VGRKLIVGLCDQPQYCNYYLPATYHPTSWQTVSAKSLLVRSRLINSLCIDTVPVCRNITKTVLHGWCNTRHELIVKRGPKFRVGCTHFPQRFCGDSYGTASLFFNFNLFPASESVHSAWRQHVLTVPHSWHTEIPIQYTLQNLVQKRRKTSIFFKYSISTQSNVSFINNEHLVTRIM